MFHEIFAAVSQFIIHVESTLGYAGLVVLMGIESCCIPLPSEVIMPYAGYLCSIGRFNLWLASLAGAIGCVVGSIPAYYLGLYGGRPLILKYGRYVLMSRHDLELADRWFERHGDITVFVARLLPVIRTFIAFPAGVNRMNVPRFIVYTFLGSYPWCLMLAYIGMKVGENIEILRPYFHRFDAVIGVALLAAIGLWIWRHLKGAYGADRAEPESVIAEVADEKIAAREMNSKAER